MIKFLSQLDALRVDVKNSEGLGQNGTFYVYIRPERKTAQIKVLFKFNNFRLINWVLRTCNKELPIGGSLLGFFEPLSKRKKRLTAGKGRFLTKIIILYDFILRRFIPKIPPFRQLNERYHIVRNKALSQCEMFGRLVYCGFQIKEYHEEGNFIHFEAVKIADAEVSQPSHYGIMIKLPRVGRDGDFIDIYKLRTMHPYAQYLHAYLIEQHGFDENGKIKDDFRVSDWGWVLRRFWIDELPQLVNLLKGETRLFGVRPIGLPLFRKYPEDLQKERIKEKPGLIPPYYVDLPKSIEEVFESERKYLEKRRQHPAKTDIEYLFKALYNIIVKNARSY